ncbi:hypothetical protein GCM10007860_25910 [Chitiniphilus shinanonensis]|uniref:Phospholipase A1 n=1 Tax=Chitiniphilus shinanonensis TaxID=553088 RepID=A0ABQ6BTW7_9NEIS|nr:phospholipase A [Chitiniphilus shinanonensis]GLS05438.1 hypothetical protein GCM10007860_25910 [Chitiniphilus shinanonensis]
MRYARIAAGLLLVGQAGTAWSAETVFLPGGVTSATVDVLYVNRSATAEQVTPAATLTCPGSRACELVGGAQPFELAPESARMLRYAYVKTETPAVPPQTDLPQAKVATPVESQIQNTSVLNYSAARFAPQDPMYFVVAPDGDDARFQFSFRYQLFDPDSNLAKRYPWLAGLRFAYTQTSLWKLSEESTPFYDTSYKPALYYEHANAAQLPHVGRFDLAYGFRHESNGKGGDESRDLNQLFVNPTFTWGDVEHWHFVFSPLFGAYLTEMEENPDIAGYRGYVDWRFKGGNGQGLTMSSLIRYGNKDKGSFQLDLSYPLRQWLGIDFYGYLQYWDGYGESLRSYDQRTNSIRVGIGFVR